MYTLQLSFAVHLGHYAPPFQKSWAGELFKAQLFELRFGACVLAAFWCVLVEQSNQVRDCVLKVRFGTFWR